jgi:CRP-like cAMP-binding protein
MTHGLPSSRLVTRLRSVTDVSPLTVRLIGELPVMVKNCEPGEIVVPQGGKPSNCCLILDGFLARARMANLTERQLISFYVPGDIPDASTLHLPVMDHNLIAIGPAVVGFIPHASMHAAMSESNELLHALWRETLIDGAIFRECIVNLGQRDGLARLAHLVCELAVRLAAVGLLRDCSLNIPWTQTDVADASGMTPIHTNRLIQELRAQGLVQWEARLVRILKWQALAEVADFSADYLHLKHINRVLKPLVG